MEGDIQYAVLFKKLKAGFSNARCGIFCNHTSFLWQERKYLVRILESMVRLEKIFIPEHGFFAELQDQDTVSLFNAYDMLLTRIEIHSFYPGDDHLLKAGLEKLGQLDLLIIDIREVGVRYFTYVTMLGMIMKALKDRPFTILLVDHPNPAGRQVEGIPLRGEYSSLIGWPGLPHRYGLTLGEIALFIKDQLDGKFHLEIIKMADQPTFPDFPYPSPNIPHPLTTQVYAGQCLWEGTNVSEGRGTTRPFEIFGAPFFKILMTDWADRWNALHPEAILRPLIFIPTFHKYEGEYCYGFQLHPCSAEYHSLWYSLKMIRNVRSVVEDFSWREGPYETGSDRNAIELLAGDDLLISYLNGKENEKIVREKLIEEERKWIDHCRTYLLYKDPLRSVCI
jgi:uncharacterized protein YbbC (DUF1343 family)